MATSKELYCKPIQGYWENNKSGNIYLLVQGNTFDNPRTKERTHWNASAINLRTGKSRKLRLRDFANLQELDEETKGELEEKISIADFYHSF